MGSNPRSPVYYALPPQHVVLPLEPQFLQLKMGITTVASSSILLKAVACSKCTINISRQDVDGNDDNAGLLSQRQNAPSRGQETLKHKPLQ